MGTAYEPLHAEAIPHAAVSERLEQGARRPAATAVRRSASVLVLVHDLHIRVLSTSGHLLLDLTLDPTRDYQPQART
jgi:hypothetical protein